MCPLPHCPSCWLWWFMGGCSSRWPSLFITLPILGGNIQANYFSSRQINLSDQVITNCQWPRGPRKMTYFSNKGKLSAGCRECSNKLDSSSIVSQRGDKGKLGYSEMRGCLSRQRFSGCSCLLEMGEQNKATLRWDYLGMHDLWGLLQDEELRETNKTCSSERDCLPLGVLAQNPLTGLSESLKWKWSSCYSLLKLWEKAEAHVTRARAGIFCLSQPADASSRVLNLHISGLSFYCCYLVPGFC